MPERTRLAQKNKNPSTILIGIITLAALLLLVMAYWNGSPVYGIMGYMLGYGPETPANGYNHTFFNYNQPFMGGMMGMMGTRVNWVQTGTMPGSIRNIPKYTTANPSNNTVTITSTNASMTVITTNVSTAVSMTGATPPSQASDNVFVIDGLIDPTIIARNGTVLNISLINMDNADYHNIAFSPAGPPYSYMPYQVMYDTMVMLPMLPPANNSRASEFSGLIRLNSVGSYWYLCTYPDHARGGMYGRIIVI